MAAKAGLVVLGLGAALAAAVLMGKKPGDEVTGDSGKRWRVVMLGAAGAVKTYEIFSPAGSFGPHGELSVLRYQQTGSDKTSRKILAVGQGAPLAMVEAAASDFGLPFDPTLMPH